MNAHTFPQIDRTIGLRADAQALINAAQTWQADLASTNDPSSFFAMQSEVRLLRAIDRLWPDFMADQIKERTDEIEVSFGCDVDGYPVEMSA